MNVWYPDYLSGSLGLILTGGGGGTSTGNMSIHMWTYPCHVKEKYIRDYIKRYDYVQWCIPCFVYALFYAIISINSVTNELTLKITKKKVYFKCPDDALN